MKKEKEVINDLTDSKPVRAVQLTDGRWITETLARNIGLLDDKVTLAHPVLNE